MYLDYEINHKDDDRLNRNEFAIGLADNIMHYKPKKALTIGIMGSWGSGKSSLINLTENILEKKDAIIIRFKPWYFSNQDNLYLQFFKQIISALRNEEINKNIFERKINPKRNLFKKQDDSFKNYFNYIKDSTSEFDIDNLRYNPNFESYDSLDYHKERCEEYIKSFDRKIIVIIDDIDRLANTEVAQIFTLVKSLADFENFIYILSFDKEIVTDALKKTNSEYKDNFIDKIIQIPISVPKISETKMDELILNEIGEIYDNTQSKINIKNDFGEIFDFLKLFIKDMRDLKRYKNTLDFYLSNYLEDLNINDFFLILAIHLFEYELFLNIIEHKDLLTLNEDQFNNTGNLIELLAYDKSKYIITDEKWNYLKDTINYLFPTLTSDPTKITNKSYITWENAHKICCEKYFEKYFTLSLENNEISQKSLDQLIQMDKTDEIFNFFTKETNLNYNHSLLIGFKKQIPEIPEKNYESFIKAIMKAGDSMEIYPHSRRYFNWIFDDLFERINPENDRYRILKECIEDYDDNVFTTSEYFYSLAEDYVIFGYNENVKSKNEMTIKKSEAENLIELIITKIHNDIANGKFFNHKYLPEMLNYWEYFEDKQSVIAYVLENVKTSDEIFSFLTKFKLNEPNPNTGLFYDFERINSYHGLKIYEKNIAEKLNETNIDDKTRESCELFLNQLIKYKPLEHPIFITHFKEDKEAYKTIEKWIDESDINWNDMSITPYPQNQQLDSEIENLLESNIKNSSLLILIMINNDSAENMSWINKEIEIAQKYYKPILATKNSKLETLQINLQNTQTKYVNWERTSVIRGIKEQLGIE